MKGDLRHVFDKLEQSLIEMRTELGSAPKAILVVSGHWEEQGFFISSGANPGMLFDYYGFPDYLYRINYAAPGSPELARRVRDMLITAGIEATLDPDRGFDHGTFSLMKPLYPEENIPVVQLSLDSKLEPQAHFEVGRALASLRDEGVLIVGSGLSYHNLSAMRSPEAYEPSRQFDAWLQQTLIHLAPDERVTRLMNWEQAPCARAAHPREDHLIPLMVALGAAADELGAVTFHQSDFAGGITASSFRFGMPPTLKHPHEVSRTSGEAN